MEDSLHVGGVDASDGYSGHVYALDGYRFEDCSRPGCADVGFGVCLGRGREHADSEVVCSIQKGTLGCFHIRAAHTDDGVVS